MTRDDVPDPMHFSIERAVVDFVARVRRAERDARDRERIDALADAIVRAFAGRRALLIASTDLSHYFDAETAATLRSLGYL